MADPLDTDDATIDDTIRDTLRELNEREGLAETAPEPEAKAEETKTEGKPARDDAGRFAKQSAPAPKGATPPGPAAPEEPVAEPEAEPDKPLVSTTGQPLDLNRAPSSWKPAAKVLWQQLPEAIRAEVYRRESDYMHGNKEIKDNADFGRTIRATVEPYRMLIQAEGGTPEGAIADTLKTAALLRIGTPQQKLQAVLDISQRFNVPLQQHLDALIARQFHGQQGQPQQAAPQGYLPQPYQGTAAQPPQYFDPRVDQLLTSMQAQERERSAEEERISNAATESFISAKDDKGNPLHPFVDNVLDDFAARVSELRRSNPALSHADVLKQAYDAATWANPETRAVLMSQQQQTAQTEQANLRKVEAAKRASGLNMPKRGSLPKGEALGSMDDTIRSTLRQLTG